MHGAQKTKLQKTNESMKQWTNELNRAFSKEEVQIAKKHMKKCSTSLAIKEMQIKICTLRFHFIPIKMATIKNTIEIQRWQLEGGSRKCAS
jgi:uncharacterized Fe-S center protein